jgi:tRNA-modifying protein YgfZ
VPISGENEAVLSIEEGYRELLAGAEIELPTAVVDVQGPDATAYLQGQMSQDVAALAPGAPAARSLLLEPSGKFGFLVDVTRLADDHYRLEVDESFGDDLVARLERFKLRTDAQITRPPGWHHVARLAPGTDGSGLVTDLRTEPPARVDVPLEAYDIVRIEAGVPRMGAEITPDVIPAELGQWLIDASVDFVKGCYTGQELVARIDSRGGNVPRHLRGLVVDGDQAPPPGAALLAGDKSVGHVTSAALSPSFGAPVALAFVHRSVEVPGPVTVRWDQREAAASVRELPLRPDA